MREGTPCPSPELLAAYIERPGDRSDVARHVSECSDCLAVVEILSKLAEEDAGGDIGAYLEELNALTDELHATPRHRWLFLLNESRFHRTDFARRLLAAGLDARWKEPALAIDLTRAAARIADVVPSEEPDRAQLKFDAWKLHSAFLRESGRYENCRAALARAADAALHVEDVEMAEASILFSRALLASEPDIWQPGEAASLLASVEATFVRRDHERWLAARSAQGTLLYRSGDRRCVEVWQDVLDRTRTTDRAAWHDALANLLLARVEHNDAAEDIDEKLLAVETEDMRRQAAALIARDRWVRGKLLALRAEHEDAIQVLHDAIDRYRTFHNYDAAVRVGIDVLLSMVALEQLPVSMKWCQTLVEWSVRLDREEPTRRRALTAQVAAYLSELARQSALTTDVVIDVRRYVFKITHQRPFPFVPPLPPYTV